eukprot:Phypoly_transcript_08956.p1 GENE.Phypoly_transcript_08956~~Phypoly_transcript_08956.p1  ORF type:complete len:175 (-),score=31.44 Phypoly_transcript_08956:792-1316(-)
MAEIYAKLDSGAKFRLYNVALMGYVFASNDSNGRDSDNYLEVHLDESDRTEFVAKKISDGVYHFKSVAKNKWWFRSGDKFYGELTVKNAFASLGGSDAPKTGTGNIVEMTESEHNDNKGGIRVYVEPGTADKILLSFLDKEHIFAGSLVKNGDNVLLSGPNRFGDQSRFVFVWV